MNRINVYRSVAACVALGSVAMPASAGDVNCAPNLGPVTVDGNVTVTSACQLDGTTVKGNILLYAGGSLVARDLRVEGNVQADRAVSLDISRSQVVGSIQLEGMTGELARVVDNEVIGNVQVKENRARVEVMANEVGADVQAFGNRGGVRVQDNAVDGNLQCKENDPAPLGGNNRVSGNKEDQCANLQSVSTPPAPGADPGTGTPGGTTLQGDVYCPPQLGAVTVDGNVLVTTACSLDGTRVKGNVLLYSGGSLVARDALVEGNIQAEFSNSVDVERTRVIGSIQLDGLVGEFSRMAYNRVDGNIQLKDNRARLEVVSNEVSADVQAFANLGGVLVQDNGIGGNLQCKDNVPAPVGGSNSVSGNREDQCANLQLPASQVAAASRPPLSSSPTGTPTSPIAGTPGSQSGGGGGGGSVGLFSLLALLLALALRPAGRAQAPLSRRG